MRVRAYGFGLLDSDDSSYQNNALFYTLTIVSKELYQLPLTGIPQSRLLHIRRTLSRFFLKITEHIQRIPSSLNEFASKKLIYRFCCAGQFVSSTTANRLYNKLKILYCIRLHIFRNK